MKHIVVLTGAGISAESGLKTFRDAGGLWEGHNIMEVASPEGWRKNPALVLDFYNQRRKQLDEVLPNAGHLALKKLEEKYKVTIVTQNVDDLHERAGSSNIIHLHGELKKAQSTLDPKLVYHLNGWEIKSGDKCEKGSQLRPFIVWFGEMVPLLDTAIQIAQTADIFMIIGTSLAVYPAASLIDYVPPHCNIYVIDPNLPYIAKRNNLFLIEKKATEGVVEIVDQLMSGLQ